MADRVTELKPEPKRRDAVARTIEVLQKLQSRLTKEPTKLSAEEDLGDELRRYFSASAQPRPSSS
jgi:hypothetical protein